jgi:hypothetical protein
MAGDPAAPAYGVLLALLDVLSGLPAHIEKKAGEARAADREQLARALAALDERLDEMAGVEAGRREAQARVREEFGQAIEGAVERQRAMLEAVLAPLRRDIARLGRRAASAVVWAWAGALAALAVVVVSLLWEAGGLPWR